MYDELENVGYAKGIIQFLEAGFVILNEAQCSQSHLLEKSITILDFGILEYISSPTESILPQNSVRLNFILCGFGIWETTRNVFLLSNECN